MTKLKRFALVLLLSVQWGRCEPPAVPTDNSDLPPPKPANAWTAGENYYPQWPTAWRQRVREEVERAKKGNIRLLFLGDSLTERWDGELWKARYEPLGAVNFGIGGDGTPQVLYRIDHGVLDGISPKVLVFEIGINNTWPGYSVADTIKGYETCLKRIKEKLPHTRILLIGLFPAFEKDNGIRPRVQSINAAIARMADGDRVRFLDVGAQLLEADGSLKKGYFQSDRLHFQAPAYRVWADAMDPVLKEMLAHQPLRLVE